MKKAITLVLVLVLTLSLAACGDGNSSTPLSSKDSGAPSSQSSAASTLTPSSEPARPSGNNGVPEGKAMASLIKWMMDGTFRFDYTMTSEGPDGISEGSGSMAVDGVKIAYSIEMIMEGQRVKSRIIHKDDKMYMIDDANKTIMEMSAEMNVMEGMMTDYGGIVLTGEGIGEIGGKTLPYEDYTESGTDSTVRYYLDGGDVYAIETNADEYKTVMIITNASGSVPASVFDLPADYTELGAFNGADMGSLEDYLPEGFEMPDVSLPDGITLPEGIKIP